MLGGIAFNAIYINKVTTRLQTALNELPDVSSPNCRERTQELLKYWEKHEPYVGLSVSFTMIDRLTEQAILLSSCAECGDIYGFRSALSLMKDCIRDVRRLEQFSVANLL
jgi:hypothetical protein